MNIFVSMQVSMPGKDSLAHKFSCANTSMSFTRKRSYARSDTEIPWRRRCFRGITVCETKIDGLIFLKCKEIVIAQRQILDYLWRNDCEEAKYLANYELKGCNFMINRLTFWNGVFPESGMGIVKWCGAFTAPVASCKLRWDSPQQFQIQPLEK